MSLWKVAPGTDQVSLLLCLLPKCQRIRPGGVATFVNNQGRTVRHHSVELRSRGVINTMQEKTRSQTALIQQLRVLCDRCKDFSARWGEHGTV